MTQPTYANLFGTGATFNTSTNKLEIPIAALAESGLDATEPTALEAFAAITKNGHGWLSTNTDAAVMADGTLNIFAPTTRNGDPKTQFGYTLNFYGSYSTPTFDPDQV
ncbi:hypothetical protein [Calothrix sp. NIES-2098]|uniref:hypothetical protein n=1 Tax=Calothrix sp. NIES-2098 TaxID=1954171 RepID=UPI000B5FA1F2|nr:hypothetical protein NIES2098_34640 [Calothrix sp. NIES-2098]